MTTIQPSGERVPPAVLRFSDARRDPTDAARFRREVRGLSRLAPGAYADVRALTPESAHELRAREVVRRLQGVVLSHVSAAVMWDLPVLRSDLETIHLRSYRSRRRSRSGPGYWIHAGGLTEEDIVARRGLGVTDVVRTIADTACLLGTDWGVVVADAALHRGDVDAGSLAVLSEVRHVSGAGFARAVPGLASGRSESAGESLTRLRLVREGWQFEEQVVLADVLGGPRVDFRLGRWLVVEFDGRAKYRIGGDPEAALWAEKQRRDRMVHAGYEVVRPVWADLFAEGGISALIGPAAERVIRRHGPGAHSRSVPRDLRGILLGAHEIPGASDGIARRPSRTPAASESLRDQILALSRIPETAPTLGQCPAATDC